MLLQAPPVSIAIQNSGLSSLGGQVSGHTSIIHLDNKATTTIKRCDWLLNKLVYIYFLNAITRIKPRTNKPRKCLKIGVFTTGDLVLVRDFRIGHSWTSETGLKRRGNVTYDIRVNDIIWIRNRNQLRPRIAETGSTSASNSLYLLIDTFKLPANKSDKAHERTSEQQISCSKWARQKLSRLRMISKLWSY
ncbi:unnamed protein product [Hymenolepis diminuta]|uniref:Uncharacterized protein n=1 Tax=Hymenolepis diminuta TaxID=6216 RepID=A0A3P6WF09_HYMDI|nr:unnamed protein product [Hymenolepis diminuta]